MQGRIIKGISGFYYVDAPGEGVFACKAKGIFRKNKIKPMVGDLVQFSVTDDKDKEGNIESITPRKSQLLRPEVANVDQALVVFAIKNPAINLYLLDRILVNLSFLDVPALICLNKSDLDETGEGERIKALYEGAGYPVSVISVNDNIGVSEVIALLKGQLTAIAGPSGVGKSSLINALQSEVLMETDGMMKKQDSGKQTTRHSQLIPLPDAGYIIDTPGFGSMFLPAMEAGDLDSCFPEMSSHKGDCRFRGCSHRKEPDCAIKAAVEDGRIAASRYENYVSFFEELKAAKKY